MSPVSRSGRSSPKRGVSNVDDFFVTEQQLMANETLRKAMADYHDLVESGRREIYRIENSVAFGP
jgi:hypothetical protein